jgi:MFS family permease
MKPKTSEAKHTIRTFAGATFLNDLGSNMIHPVWPLFVTEILRANMAALGFLDGMGEALVSIAKALSGYLSDRWHQRKIFIWLGYLFTALARFGYSLAHTWPQLIPFRILDRLAKERSAPRDALVADVSTYKNRGSHFGFIRAMDHLGGICGILLCLLLLKFLGYRTIFALAAIPTVVSAVLVFIFIKEKKATLGPAGAKLNFREVGRDYRLFLGLSSVFTLGTFSYSFLLLYAKNRGFAVTDVILLYLIFTASASLSSFAMGKAADKLGRKPVLYVCYSLWLLVCLLLVTVPSRFVILFCFILYGAHKGILIPIQRTVVSECSLNNFRASCLGGFYMVTGLCALPASFLAGVLWEAFGMLIPFYAAMGFSTIALVLLSFLKLR